MLLEEARLPNELITVPQGQRQGSRYIENYA
jgi:hypothetical protein